MRLLGCLNAKAANTCMEDAHWADHGGPVPPQRKFLRLTFLSEGFWGQGGLGTGSIPSQLAAMSANNHKVTLSQYIIYVLTAERILVHFA